MCDILPILILGAQQKQILFQDGIMTETSWRRLAASALLSDSDFLFACSKILLLSPLGVEATRSGHTLPIFFTPPPSIPFIKERIINRTISYHVSKRSDLQFPDSMLHTCRSTISLLI